MRTVFLIFYLIFFSNFVFGQNKVDNENNYLDLTEKKDVSEPIKEKKHNSEVKAKIDNKSLTVIEKPKNDKEKINKSKFNSSVQIGKLNSPSLGSIGIETSLNRNLGLNIWNKFSAKEAIENLHYIPDVVSSKHFQKFLLDLYSSVSIPPSGTSSEIIKFVETKLLKISASGSSANLQKIVLQLPNDKRWEKWKKWYVEFNLIKKKDKEACKNSYEFLNESTDSYWRKVNLICLLINEKFDEASLIHDVMVSENLIDSLFQMLFKSIVDNTDFEYKNLEETKLEALHIIMLDILGIPITAKMIANFDPEYADALIDLINIEPDARSFLLDKLISFKDIEREKVRRIYQSVIVSEPDKDIALKKLLQNANGINRSHVWLSALGIKDDVKQVEYIIKILEIENNLGRLNQTLDLYLPILVSVPKKSLPDRLNKTIEYLQILYKPEKFNEKHLAKIILMSKGDEWDLNIIKTNRAWSLIPYLEKSGMKSPDQNWLKLLNSSNLDVNFKNNFDNWSYNASYKKLVLRKAIESKIEKNDKIYAILLIARLFKDNSMYNFDIKNLQFIEDSLQKLKLPNLGKKIRIEVLSSKFASLKIKK